MILKPQDTSKALRLIVVNLSKKYTIMCKIYKRFDNVKTFAEYLENGTTQPVFVGYQYSKTKDRDFTGTANFDEAHSLMLYGDKNLQKKIEAAGVSDLRTNIRKYVAKRQVYSSVVGAMPNVPAYLAGAPNSMINVRKQKQNQTVVNVGYNSAVFGGVDAVDIIRGGAKLVAALMILEAKGIKANVYCLDLDTEGSEYVSYSIKIKSSGQKFDTLRMAYFLAHPSMNRRHKFRFEEVTEGISSHFVFGYGRPETNDNTIKKHFHEKCHLDLDAAFNYESLSNMTTDQIINRILGKD